MGANPSRKSLAVVPSNPRALRYLRAGLASGLLSWVSNHIVASSLVSTRVLRRALCESASADGAGIAMPHSLAICSTASTNESPSSCITNPKMSPCASHPKQWKNPFSSLIVKEGVFSLWKGHKPLNSIPCWVRVVRRPANWLSDTRVRRSSRKLGGKPIVSSLCTSETFLDYITCL